MFAKLMHILMLTLQGFTVMKITQIPLVLRVVPDSSSLWEYLTAAWKALSRANAKGTGIDDWVIRSLD
jgi:hypothetical protein